MKDKIHPDYHEVSVHCSCGNTWKTKSTLKELRIEICSQCHPFFTGKAKLIDSAGRVERFQRRYAATAAATAAAATAAAGTATTAGGAATSAAKKPAAAKA